MSKTRPQTPRGMFIIALADWQRAWTTHADHDRRAASVGYATRTGQAHLTAMADLSTRIADIEGRIAQTTANNRAELHIKITLLSLDGQIRPEFQSSILEDAMRMIAEAKA